jgi:1-acyl-sn-glycerol-3-phosphate acyltransferase
LLVEDEVKTGGATLIQDTWRMGLATAFYLAASVTHDVVIYGREHVSGHHPTLLLCNHKRDFDSVVLAGVAYVARGMTQPNERLIYSLREDAFWPDFLEAYLGWRGPLRLELRGPLRFLKAYPMGYVRGRADLPRVEAQLRKFASLLDRGRDLYWTPEGGLSLDGRLERFRAGFYRIVQMSRAPLRILPAAIFYDYMTSTRTRCFIRFGPEISVDRSLAKPALEQQARVAILRQMTLNAGHLMAAVLRELPPDAEVDRDELEQRLLAHARRYRAAGLALDGRLMRHGSFRLRVSRLLQYLRRQGILGWDGRVWRVGRGMEHKEMRYVVNELLEVELALGIETAAG